jgi:hypothetical protein
MARSATRRTARPTNPSQDDRMTPTSARPWLLLSIAGAALAIAGSLLALADQQVYDKLSAAFLPQALAQDLVNLFVASPAILILALLALRGSLGAYVLWLGSLLFTAYNYVIYAVAIPFGSLFLLWVAVLGMALFALLGGAAVIDRGELLARYRDRRTATVAGWALLVIAVLFGALWLSEDVPALLAGSTPASLVEQGVITNPVHVLDLAFFLPATVLVAAAWLRGSGRAAAFGPAFLAFLLLTGLPILVTPVVQTARGDTATWAVVVPIGVISLVVLALLVALVPRMERVQQPG